MTLKVVLVEPEIHWNTGNIGRSCIGAGAELHLVKPLGFSLDSAQIRRSGLDYWPRLKLTVHEDWASAERAVGERNLFLFHPRAPRTVWEAPFTPDSALVLGKESVGLPLPLLEKYADRVYRIPTTSDIRSLNLSTSAGIVLFEALRRVRGA